MLAADDCVSVLKSGTNLVKVKSSRRHYQRRFSLDDDGQFVQWESQRKSSEESRSECLFWQLQTEVFLLSFCM